MSTRPDMLPQELIIELEKLQDKRYRHFLRKMPNGSSKMNWAVLLTVFSRTSRILPSPPPLLHRCIKRYSEKLESDIAELIELYAYRPLKELEIGNLLHRIASVVAECQLKAPRDFYLLAKALVTIEGVGKELDPEFNAVSHAEPFAEKIIWSRMSPRKLIEDFYLSALETRLLLRDLPSEARDILARVLIFDFAAW